MLSRVTTAITGNTRLFGRHRTLLQIVETRAHRVLVLFKIGVLFVCHAIHKSFEIHFVPGGYKQKNTI